MTAKELQIIDTHAHLDMSVFDKDRPEVMARAKSSHVHQIINPTTDLESGKKAISLTKKYLEILVGVGFHPHDSTGVSEVQIMELTKLVNNPKVVAIGEIGLDFYRDYAPREIQIKTLKLQLDLAARVGLPIIIHCRQAENEMLYILHDWLSSNSSSQRQSPGVIHCFNGGKDTLRQYLEMGFYIALGAYIGYPTVKMYDVILNIPDDRLVVETDCPFLPPQNYRGKRNEPAYISLTIEALSRVKNETYAEISQKTTENARRLFRLPVI